MKRLLMISAFATLLLMGVSAIAQEQQAPPPAGPGGGRGRGMMMSPDERTEMLSKELNLTADQKTKVKDIYSAQSDKMKALREDTSTAPEDRRGKMMDIQKDTNEKINAVLDKDQQKKFSEMQERMRNRRGPGGPPPAGEAGQRPPQ